MRRILVLAAMLFAIPAHAVVTIEWVTVGDAGNACDSQLQGCFGSVAEPYRIGKFEVTNAQYTEFLNAVAAADTNGLYNTNMANTALPFFGGITRSGSSGSFTYSAIAGRKDMPVNHVSFYDVLRFANWLHNGQPTGAQDNTTTENGAYTITAQGISDNSITRNAGATIFLPSEDEWFKAAYYDALSTSFFDYPAASDTITTCTTPGSTANTANCVLAVLDLTDAGSYTGAASPNGTFDQGGNVSEWSEAIVPFVGRGLRGGNFGGSVRLLDAAMGNGISPLIEDGVVGFRVASPVPAFVPTLSPAGLLVFAAGLLGFIGYYRRRF